VTAYESGEWTPEPERVEQLATVLHFPVRFFMGDDLDELDPNTASFRALTKMTSKQRDTALGAGRLAILLNEWVNERFVLPPTNIPDSSREQNPEASAIALRREWGLGELPVKNMVHLLESQGVRVFSLSLDTLTVDAFSLWRQDTAFVFLNTKKSTEHSRFDAAHELAHLLLHRHGAPQGQSAEKEAHAFASAFLMPRGSVLANVPPRIITLERLVKLKKYWNVSVAALAYRLLNLEVLNGWQYRLLASQIASKGYRRKEPESSPRETSQIWEKVFAALRAENITIADIAADLHMPKQDVGELVFGLAILGLDGRSANKPPLDKRPKHLRAVP
jgi:Zn-dependent peptidase ImmA (M78 family)